MRPIIYDNTIERGIDIEFDFKNGMGIRIFLDDKAAHDMIQNKLNARVI